MKYNYNKKEKENNCQYLVCIPRLTLPKKREVLFSWNLKKRVWLHCVRRGRLCLPSARRGRIHSLPWGVTWLVGDAAFCHITWDTCPVLHQLLISFVQSLTIKLVLCTGFWLLFDVGAEHHCLLWLKFVASWGDSRKQFVARDITEKLLVTLSNFSNILVSVHKNCGSIAWRCLRDPLLSRFCRILTCGRRTDGHRAAVYTALVLRRAVKILLPWDNGKSMMTSSPTTPCACHCTTVWNIWQLFLAIVVFLLLCDFYHSHAV